MHGLKEAGIDLNERLADIAANDSQAFATPRGEAKEARKIKRIVVTRYGGQLFTRKWSLPN